MAKNKGKNKPAIPQGNYVELNIDHIDEGDFRKQLEDTIRRAFEQLIEREKISDDRSGKAKIKCELMIERESEKYFSIKTKVDHKVDPLPARSYQFREGGGKMLTNPDDSLNDTDQLRLFDKHGKSAGAVDLQTGEVLDEEADTSVAGKVGGA